MAYSKKILELIDVLYKKYGDPKCALNYQNPFELLVAVILSAQCTDKRVNIVTKELFKEIKTPKELMEADNEKIEKLIYSTGFYKAKTTNLKACSKMLVEEYGGEVPIEMEDLIRLGGVGRKTANVVRGEIFNLPAITVDTHVKRLSKRIGITKNSDPVKVEFDLRERVPRDKWFQFSNLLILHGRAVCLARKPKCEICEIVKICDFGGMNK